MQGSFAQKVAYLIRFPDRREDFSQKLTLCKALQGRRLTGKPSVSRIEILSSNLSVPAISTGNRFLRKGSLTGKAVVLKTTAHCRLRVRVLSLPPNWRRRLMVWQRFAKSPRLACAGSIPVASAKVLWTCSSGELERDSAKVEDARSNRARFTIPA